MHTPIDAAAAERGYSLFHRDGMCASCHGTHAKDGLLTQYKVNVTPVSVVRTDSERAVLMNSVMDGYETTVGKAIAFSNSQQESKQIEDGYVANPLCSTFLNYPYLHTAGVANLHELLTAEKDRSDGYYVGETIDVKNVGFPTTLLGLVANVKSITFSPKELVPARDKRRDTPARGSGRSSRPPRSTRSSST
jgi:hypothetical protein